MKKMSEYYSKTNAFYANIIYDFKALLQLQLFFKCYIILYISVLNVNHIYFNTFRKVEFQRENPD